jgi:hypothetical protein
MARQRSGKGGFLTHGRLVAVEALLLAAWLKSLLTDAIVGSGMQNWVKVVVVMGMTVGLLGSVLLWLESLTRAGVKQSHQVVRGLAGGASALWVHAGVLLALFLLYARMLHLKVL